MQDLKSMKIFVRYFGFISSVNSSFEFWKAKNKLKAVQRPRPKPILILIQTSMMLNQDYEKLQKKPFISKLQYVKTF